MHQLASTPGKYVEQNKPVDLKQDPADLVILSSLDSDLCCLSYSYKKIYSKLEGKIPTLRLANLSQINHNLSLDLYMNRVLKYARCIIIRILGGKSYWSYGIEQIISISDNKTVIFLPGDNQFDKELFSCSNIKEKEYMYLLQYFREGGFENSNNLLKYVFLMIK